MERTVSAIVLKRADRGEADRRLTLLTPDMGKLEVIARGAKKPQSRLAAGSEPLSVGEYGIAATRKTWFVTGVRPVSVYKRLRTDYWRLHAALSITEICAACVPFGADAAPEWHLLNACLAGIESADDPFPAYAWALAQWLQITGFAPNLDPLYVLQRDGHRIVLLSPGLGTSVHPETQPWPIDVIEASWECGVALARLPLLEAPPAKMQGCSDVVRVLVQFVRAHAESELPVTQALVSEWTTHVSKLQG
ncbi:MAG: DNA repair protein RecO [Fimbriimonadaceae bacterium]|nr:DNA repair protein RecO [Fimbriimonadaceae bacterium]